MDEHQPSEREQRADKFTPALYKLLSEWRQFIEEDDDISSPQEAHEVMIGFVTFTAAAVAKEVGLNYVQGWRVLQRQMEFYEQQ